MKPLRSLRLCEIVEWPRFPFADGECFFGLVERGSSLIDQMLRRGRFSLILGKLITKELLLQKDVLGISIRECVASSSKGALLIPMNQSTGVDELF